MILSKWRSHFAGCAVLVVGWAGYAVNTVRAAAPVRVIFDTDLGSDVDDAGAVAVLHAAGGQRGGGNPGHGLVRQALLEHSVPGRD